MKSVFKFNTEYGIGEIYYNDDYIIKFQFYFDKQIRVENNYNVPLWVNHLKNDIIKYLSGEKIDFKKYKLDLKNFTKFEKDILNNLREVGYGKIISYKKLGEIAGYKNSSRAVGSVMRKNPFPIIIPCHRVVKSNGAIGGYSQGAMYKKFLLDMEVKIQHRNRNF